MKAEPAAVAPSPLLTRSWVVVGIAVQLTQVSTETAPVRLNDGELGARPYPLEPSRRTATLESPAMAPGAVHVTPPAYAPLLALLVESTIVEPDVSPSRQ